MKKILLSILVISTIFCFGCNKDDNSDMVQLNPIDITALSNKDIKDVVEDDSLDEGVYQINTSSKKYIYFYGKKHNFIDIDCTLENKTLIISASTEKSSSISKQLFVIYEKNTTSSDNKLTYFDTINLSIDKKNVPFKSIF